MPIKTLYNHDSQLIHTTCSGKTSQTELIDYHKTVWLEPGISDYNELIDFSEADISSLSFSDINLITQAMPEFITYSSQSKLALLIDNFHQGQKIGFYMSARSNSDKPVRPMKDFTSMDKALDWLLIH